jgi:hypothetical protein
MICIFGPAEWRSASTGRPGFACSPCRRGRQGG